MSSEGDPRVLLAMNVALSFAFSVLVVWALSFAGISTFSWRNVGAATAFLVAVTYVVVLR